jgi:5'-phosphate synthase pdxT subunit
VEIGVLALQGGFSAHAGALDRLGHEVRLIRYPDQLRGLEGLVLPGGESSTQLELLRRADLAESLDAMVRSGRPVLATCAGLILAAREVVEPRQQSLGWIDVTVTRNGWGRQLDSFEAESDRSRLPLIFIRAPRISTLGPEVEVLETLDGEPVLVRQGSFVGATFHPELTDDLTVASIVFGEC